MTGHDQRRLSTIYTVISKKIAIVNSRYWNRKNLRDSSNSAKARFKRRIFHASNIIHELSAWKMRRLKQLNSADLIYVRLVSHIRQRQSNIRQKFDCGFRRRISHAANKMHKLCLLARLPSNRFFFWMVDSNAMRRNSSSVHHGVYQYCVQRVLQNYKVYLS